MITILDQWKLAKSNYYYIWVMPHHSRIIGRTSVRCILLLTCLRAREKLSPSTHESDSTKSQHIFVNLEFCGKILGSIKNWSSIFFRVRFWQCIFENQKWRMWLKSKSIPKVNSSILNVFKPKFSIFAKQQYPSFSTSLRRNVAKANQYKNMCFFLTH